MEQQIIYQREDGSFVITKNGYPYHVPNEGKFQELWVELSSKVSSGELTAIPEPKEPEPELTIEEQLAIIDMETSSNITSGFDYSLEGFDSYHFSYDIIDQQNFADAANIATLKKLGLPGLPDTVDWNAWTVVKDEEGNIISKDMTRITLTPELLLDLYRAAITHKNTQIALGSIRKQELLNSISKEN